MSDHDVVDFVVHVGEVREAAEMRCCSPLALWLGFRMQMYLRLYAPGICAMLCDGPEVIFNYVS